MPITEVLSDEEKIMQAIRQFQASAKTFWGACVNSSLPAFSVNKVKQGYLEAKSRGARIMYITEITKENLPYCREIMEVAELRHMDRVKGNFAVSDTQYVAGVKRGDLLVILVKSDEWELVRQQRHIFDMLWDHAVPAEQMMSRI